jgi:crotonobetainyl-CoA:carnitine CoA-transferase CaiB-like acyl-CoA transferase
VQPSVESLGEGPLQRLYRAATGWFFLAATEAMLPVLADIVAAPELTALAGEALAEALAHQFLTAPAEHWVRKLQASRIGAHEAVGVEALMAEPWVRDHGLSVTQVLDQVGETVMPGVSVRMSRTPPRLGDPVRHHGRDAALVLAAIDSDRTVGELVTDGVLRVSGVPVPSW